MKNEIFSSAYNSIFFPSRSAVDDICFTVRYDSTSLKVEAERISLCFLRSIGSLLKI